MTHSAGDASALAAYTTPKPGKEGVVTSHVCDSTLGTASSLEKPRFFLGRLRRLLKLGDSFLFDIGSVRELSSRVAGPCLETRELESACASRSHLLLPVSGLSGPGCH